MVSLALLFEFHQAGFSPKEQAVWQRVQSSLAVLEYGGRNLGVAALIDPKGMFIAHRSAVPAQQIVGRLSNGQRITLRLRSQDERTQMVLLDSPNWGELKRSSISLAASQPEIGSHLMVVMAQGPAKANLYNVNLPGLMRPSLYYLPLCEVRFSEWAPVAASGMIFGMDGKLVGVLSATFDPVYSQQMAAKTGTNDQRNAAGGSPKAESSSPKGVGSNVDSQKVTKIQAGQRFGPETVTVSYALGVQVLQRVVDGFLSATGKPLHPAIGILFKDAAQGVLVEVVMPGTPAERAGLVVGDLILKANDEPMKRFHDLASFLFRQKIGSTVKLVYRRGEKELEAEVEIEGCYS